MSQLRHYPTGTKIVIGDRSFEKVPTGSFWREDLGVGGDRVTELPAVTLEAIEHDAKTPHTVLGTLFN